MTERRRSSVDWPSYLATFHAQRPGITEAVLTQCRARGQNPYAWLVEGVDQSGRILDLACGSAPTRSPHATGWVGIDRSADELAAARRCGARDLAIADATRLPFVAATFDTVVCAMALMLVDPLTDALQEIVRVLRPGGALHVLLPATRPLTWPDRVRIVRLSLALRSPPQFPKSALSDAGSDPFAAVGLTVARDEVLRFRYPLETETDADRLVDSLYLPNVGPHRRERGRARARSWVGGEFGIPLRAISAFRRDPSAGPRAALGPPAAG